MDAPALYEELYTRNSLVGPHSYRLALEKDGLYSYGILSFQFPTSSVRDEQRRQRPVSHTRPAVLRPSPTRADAVLEIAPNADGLFTVDNPVVSLYLKNLIRWPQRTTSLPRRVPILDRPGLTRRQRMIDACRAASTANVNAVLDLGKDLSELECSCVLTLAALSVFHERTRPGHAALWGAGVWAQTAETVQRVCYDLDPCPVEPPICWFGTQQMRKYYDDHIALRALHRPEDVRTRHAPLDSSPLASHSLCAPAFVPGPSQLSSKEAERERILSPLPSTIPSDLVDVVDAASAPPGPSAPPAFARRSKRASSSATGSASSTPVSEQQAGSRTRDEPQAAQGDPTKLSGKRKATAPEDTSGTPEDMAQADPPAQRRRVSTRKRRPTAIAAAAAAEKMRVAAAKASRT
ncbi:hypothetical protein B0H21DRAFT_826278 [Amylocystis lapponica]|nr:hypothetical protein B0H21DRAFT_826278 [Amylocystis lapponica]